MLNSWNERFNAVCIQSDTGTILLINVYAPCDYGNTQSLDDFTNIIGALNSFLMISYHNHCIIAGDFNNSVDSRFMKLLKGFAYDHKVTFFDMMWLREDILLPYCNDDGLHESWMDHISYMY